MSTEPTPECDAVNPELCACTAAARAARATHSVRAEMATEATAHYLHGVDLEKGGPSLPGHGTRWEVTCQCGWGVAVWDQRQGIAAVKRHARQERRREARQHRWARQERLDDRLPAWAVNVRFVLSLAWGLAALAVLLRGVLR